MKIIFPLFLFFLAQSQEQWKTIYTDFSGSNWDASGWLTYNSYGGPFSQCGDTKLFGGYYVFKESTLVSSKYILPPHYSLRISLDFWKEINLDQFQVLDDKEICGLSDYQEYHIPFTTTINEHRSQSLVILMFASTAWVSFENWGFQNFTIQILECPQGCVYCIDQTSSCNFWVNISSYLNNLYNYDGWQINGVKPSTQKLCVYMQNQGGINILTQGERIEKLIQNLPPHFKIKLLFKLWIIGYWVNEVFDLEIDDELKYFIQLNANNYYSDYLDSVNFTNIDVSSLHSSTKLKLSMNVKDIIIEKYWGLQSIELFLAKCTNGCQECTGEFPSQCIPCLTGWKQIDYGCIPPPLECSQIRITQFYNKKVDFINSFKIQSDEIAQNIGEIGQTTLIIDKLISSITFDIQVKCQEKMIINSFFRNCDQCYEEEYKYSNKCPNQSNILNYYATFLQVIENTKELIYSKLLMKLIMLLQIIINISQTKLEIIQVCFDL